MQTIFEGIDLYEDLPTEIPPTKLVENNDKWNKISYKERVKVHTSNMLTKKLHNDFTHEQIQTIINTYFNFIETGNKIFRGLTRYFLMAGATFLICNNIDLVLKLFTEISPTLRNSQIILMYSTLINKECTYYDEASRELALKSS